jgi:hypothetical protein
MRVYIEFVDGSTVFNEEETTLGSSEALYKYLKLSLFSNDKFIVIKDNAENKEQIIATSHIVRIILE